MKPIKGWGSAWLDQIIASYKERGKHSPEGIKLATIAGCVLVFAFIIVSIIIVPANQAREYNFIREEGSITYLSGILLAMGSGFALVSFLTSEKETRYSRFFWFIMAGAIGFLALDELMAFHERLGYKLDALDRDGILHWLTFNTVRAWNDVIVMSYGVVALGIAVCFLPNFIRYPRLFEYMAIAGSFYFVHTITDSFVEPPNTYSVIFEESCKLYCSTFTALAFLAALLCRIRESSVKDE